jgi:hypothetical protein
MIGQKKSGLASRKTAADNKNIKAVCH